METLIEIYMLAKANAWSMVGLYVALGLISLLIANRSQIDEWAEKNPRVAGIQKLMRSLGIDPWMLLQGLSLLIRGKLPKPKAPENKSGGDDGNTGTRDHIVFTPLQSEPPASDESSVNRLRFAAVLIALVVALPSCRTMRDAVWPTVVRCSSPPEEIVSDVMAVLMQDGGGSLTDRAVEALEQLAATHGASLVTCAVNELANRLVGASGEQAAVAAKANQFLELKGARVEAAAGAAPCSE